VRTILGINNEDQSMVFAGDVPEGARIRFMKANFDKLIDAAVTAAHSSAGSPQAGSQKVAILISCVGRKLVLGKRVEEEVEAVRDTLAPDVLISGFYSYGEISPSGALTQCELHNQTMTITTFEEI
ncbi:MAG: histidine kinase, partial [Cytophaga sp.]|nr:histidine kinase [Cytophaga sp.]